MSSQNQPEVDTEGVSDVGTSVPRRQFLKRSGAATAGTILAWHGSRVDVYAEQSDDPPYPPEDDEVSFDEADVTEARKRE